MRLARFARPAACCLLVAPSYSRAGNHREATDLVLDRSALLSKQAVAAALQLEKMARPRRFEHLTYGFVVRRSIQLS